MNHPTWGRGGRCSAASPRQAALAVEAFPAQSSAAGTGRRVARTGSLEPGQRHLRPARLRGAERGAGPAGPRLSPRAPQRGIPS